MAPKISVIIPAHNEESQIAETLESLTLQTFKDFEVIVVANGCIDNTVEITKRYLKRLPLRIIETRRRGIAFACNYGARYSKGDILFFLEADTLISSNALAAVTREICNGKIGGTLKMKPKEKRLLYELGTRLLEVDEGAGWGPVRFCRSQIYNKIKGHNEHIKWMIDNDFARRVKSQGPTAYIKYATQTTSMRRFEKLGWTEVIKQAYAFLLYSLTGKTFEKEYPVVR